MSRESDIVKRTEVRVSRDEVERVVAALALAKATPQKQRTDFLTEIVAVATRTAEPPGLYEQDWSDWSDSDRVTVTWTEETT